VFCTAAAEPEELHVFMLKTFPYRDELAFAKVNEWRPALRIGAMRNHSLFLASSGLGLLDNRSIPGDVTAVTYSCEVRESSPSKSGIWANDPEQDEVRLKAAG
jgi:hypothetical protein